MPSLFSRARTTSTHHQSATLPSLAVPLAAADEFGRVSSRTSAHNAPSKKDKKKSAKDSDKRSRTISTKGPASPDGLDSPLVGIPDGSFLPLNLNKPHSSTSDSDVDRHDYGYLSYERHVVLSIEHVARLIDIVCAELTSRGGLTTPFIFSSLALDINHSSIKKLIRSFLSTCGSPSDTELDMRLREEARFAGLNELGMCLRWGLARVVRVSAGQEVRGVIAWDQYVDFRDTETDQHYPPGHFSYFLNTLIRPLQHIIVTLLTFLSRLTANSSTSGHTPPSLSPLFGPLLFGLGPATLDFHSTYINYLRSTTATEHLLLSFIRWQDSLGTGTGSASTTLGVPARLKDWIRGYPNMLPAIYDRQNVESFPQARRGSKTARVVSVRRNVRMYSGDLVHSSGTWGTRSAIGGSKEWERIAPSSLKLKPRYSEAYKKRMNLPPNFHPDTGAGSVISQASSTISYASTATLTESDEYLSGNREGEDRFKTLTDLKWGVFETNGFGGLGVDNMANEKLQFDLTEGARTARAAKRATLSWNDFSTAGFTRNDEPLKDTLQFSAPLTNSVTSWPSHNVEITKKLKKTQKTLPAFGWDTEPVMGSEEFVEEAFLDVFCDLVYGGGWMDLERLEEYDRECNWALVEFKSIPPSQTSVTGTADPRTSATLLLFEEFVPLEYRQQLTSSSGRRRLPSLFSASSKPKQWKPAATLNGRPYVVGQHPKSMSYREREFEGLLRGGSDTKVISATGTQAPLKTPQLSRLQPPSETVAPPISSPLYVNPRPDTPGGENQNSPMKKSGPRFRLPNTVSSPTNRRAGLTPAEYSSLDFETRLATAASDEDVARDEEVGDSKRKRREAASDDAWVDILVGSQSRRYEDQAAQMRAKRSDPALASFEVAQALANVRRASTSFSDEGDMEPVHGTDVDEVETVPRRSVDGYRLEPASENDDNADEDDLDPNSPSAVLRRAKERRRQLQDGGYFSVHSDRRPSSGADIVASHRQHGHDYSADADEEDGLELHDDEAIYGPPEIAQLQSARTVRALPHPPGDTVEIPHFNNDDEARAHRELDHSKTDSVLLPGLSPYPDGKNGKAREIDGPAANSTAQAAIGSKTSALIEMYRQREQGNNIDPISVHPSRLPVPVRALSSKETAAIPPPPPLHDSSPEDEYLEPPTLQPDTGRSSPGRYIHGAPLHNVLEEDDEE